MFSISFTGEVKCLDKNLDASTASGNGVDAGLDDVGVGGGGAKSNGKNVNITTMPIAGTATKKPANTSITPTGEINFKFPLDDRVCTIDELTLPPAPPPPQAVSNNLIYHATPTANGYTGTATAMAAVAAAATVLPPGAPSSVPPTVDTPLLPAETVVVVLPPPTSHMCSNATPTHLSHLGPINDQQQQQQQQRPAQQQLLQLTSLEPIVSVN